MKSDRSGRRSRNSRGLPFNILDRIVFYDDDSKATPKELTPDERAVYLDEIKKDIRFFARSYSKADVAVRIDGLGPVEAAKHVRIAIEQFIRQS